MAFLFKGLEQPNEIFNDGDFFKCTINHIWAESLVTCEE